MTGYVGLCPNKAQQLAKSLPESLFLGMGLSTLYLSLEAKVFAKAGKFILIHENGQVGKGLENHALRNSVDGAGLYEARKFHRLSLRTGSL